MATVQRWTGREARALREAARMTVRAFASHLGISDRTVSKWESRGAAIAPTPDSQALLDTALSRFDAAVQQRFHLVVGGPPNAVDVTGTAAAPAEHVPSIDTPAPVRSPSDGKKMVLVPAGIFLFGSDREAVWLPGYYIDAEPVTNADYANFIEATGHRRPAHWPNGTYPPEIRRHPIVHVTHDDATAYAQWAQKALPTSQQWEKAARGERGRTYPWGDQPTAAKCNVVESGIDRTTPVDRYHSGTSPYGCYDMSGNIWEWCSTETDPGRFVLRGSAFTSPFRLAQACATNDAARTMQDDDTGFRCVTPQTAFSG
ncbi:SUMF1/EgtB/PvdO family nonheme iron enzyme [Pilimelia columellifera]|uniref:HTH cro/C1-type domain-containing protein n=1 Tax=Pilimelia columellifera subsp. columellifera TaxID=706583 RepID=A0ABN3N4S5_9ACTN